MPRVMVTGGSGFLGRHMVRSLAGDGHEVTATHLRSPPREAARSVAGVTWRQLDLCRSEDIGALIREVEPEVIYHFAGQAYVVPSWERPGDTFAVNVRGTLELLEAARKSRAVTTFVFAGSGTEYGAPEQVPTPETAPLLPTSPYATSKAAGDLLCYQYHASYGLGTRRLRIFGTTGPGKDGDVCNDFASQVAQIAAVGTSGTMRVGDLDKQRDLVDVEDAIRAMRRIAERGAPGDAYNVGSGVARPLAEILRTLETLAAVRVQVERDPARFRKVDEPVHLGNIARLRALGWAPEIPFELTLRRILEHWKARLPAPAR